MLPWSIFLLEKLIVVQLVKEFPVFMEPKGSLPWSQDPSIGPYYEPHESNLWFPTLFL